jgi:cytoskeletal protein CcmA (bactofilin family)
MRRLFLTLADMRQVSGEVAGPLSVVDDVRITGMVAGNVTVNKGGHLELLGMVTGDIKIEDGGTAVVRSMVCGDALNAGNLTVYGMISGRMNSTSGATTTITPGSQIHGVVHQTTPDPSPVFLPLSLFPSQSFHTSGRALYLVVPPNPEGCSSNW